MASIDENRTNEFLKVASDLEIQGLVKEVKNHLKENPADVDDSSGEVEDMVESDVNINHKDHEDAQKKLTHFPKDPPSLVRKNIGE